MTRLLRVSLFASLAALVAAAVAVGYGLAGWEDWR